MSSSHAPQVSPPGAELLQEPSSGGWTAKTVVGLFSIVMLLEIYSLSYLMVSTGLPSISAHYQTTQGAWMVTAFMLTGAMVSPLVAKLADLYGKRRILMTCVAIACVGALISAVAPSYAIMIVGRVLFGAFVPCLFLSYLLIRDTFPARTVVLSVSIATSGLGLVAIPAPFLIGWMIDSFGFRSLFWFMVVTMILAAAAVRLAVDESNVRVASTIDYVGAVLLGCGIGAVLVAVSFGPSWGWSAASTITYLIVGIVLLTAWLVTAGKIPQPLVDLTVLRRRPVFLTTTTAGVAYALSGINAVLLPMLAMTPGTLNLGYGFGYNAKQFAVLALPLTVGIVLSGVGVGMLVARGMPPRVTMIAGLVMGAAGFITLAVNHSDLGVVLVASAIVGVGQGTAYAAAPNLLIASVSPRYQATTASIMSVNQGVFTAVLSVVVFAVLNESHIAIMAEGEAFYDSAGFRIGYLILGAIAVVGAVMALCIPRRLSDTEDEIEDLDRATLEPLGIDAEGL